MEPPWGEPVAWKPLPVSASYDSYAWHGSCVCCGSCESPELFGSCRSPLGMVTHLKPERNDESRTKTCYRCSAFVVYPSVTTYHDKKKQFTVTQRRYSEEVRNDLEDCVCCVRCSFISSFFQPSESSLCAPESLLYFLDLPKLGFERLLNDVRKT